MPRIAMQIAAIVLVGSVVGLADAFVFRPIQFGRAVPPPPDVTATSPANSSKPPARPEQTAATVQPAVPQSGGQSSEGPRPTPNPAFSPTPKEKLPAGHLTLDDAKALFDAGASFVDSRKRQEHELAHIPGSLRIELSDFARGDPQALLLLSRDTNIVVYCNGGNCDESEKVAEMLSNSGYAKVYVLHDGLPGWQAMGWPTQSGPGIIP